MIVAERKPFEEIVRMLAPYRKVLVLGCGGCVTVCLSGGERQADMLASQLRLAAKAKNQDLTVDVDCITRQCDREFVGNLKADLGNYDAVLSIACGVGVGYMSGLFPKVTILPGLDTTSYAANTANGIWEEYCHGCGECQLAWTGGICPIARCSKNLLNGACGGTSAAGKCEVNKDMDCAWHLIYEKLAAIGKIENLRQIRPAKDWRKDRGAGVRRLTHKEMVEETKE